MRKATKNDQPRRLKYSVFKKLIDMPYQSNVTVAVFRLHVSHKDEDVSAGDLFIFKPDEEVFVQVATKKGGGLKVVNGNAVNLDDLNELSLYRVVEVPLGEWLNGI